MSYLPLGKDESGKFIAVKPTDPKIYLPPLDHPVPSDWVSEHGRYLLVYALNLCFLDPVNLLAPKSRVDDGVIWLVMVKSSMQRKDIVDWLMGFTHMAYAPLSDQELGTYLSFLSSADGKDLNKTLFYVFNHLSIQTSGDLADLIVSFRRAREL